MATFGGFSNNALIANFIEYIVGEQEFIAMVISHSNLLAPFNRKPSEITAVAKRQSYPRIGLILAAAKNTDNTYLFADSLDPSNFSSLFNNVLTVMTDPTCPFSEGITRVAAALTASVLIRQLPLNGDIKNIDLGNKIEEQAINDLDRIIGLLSGTEVVSSFSTTLRIPEGDSIYVSLGIDKATLPANYFNVDPSSELNSFEELYPGQEVKVLNELSIPSNVISYCYFYHSAWEQIIKDTDGNNYLQIDQPIEGYFEIKDGWKAENIISALADLFNESGLRFINTRSNIIAAPVRGNSNLSEITLLKSAVYPDIDDAYTRKPLSFRLLYRIHYLSFNTRRYSNIVSRELIVVKFHTIEKQRLAELLFPALIPAYLSSYSPLTEYQAGSIIDFNNQSYILTAGPTTGISPIDDPIAWSRLYTDLTNAAVRDASTDRVEGVIYGLIPSYSYLEEQGPKSLIVKAEKGGVEISTASVLSQRKYLSDTFYFRFADGFLSVAGDLRIRFSSTDIEKNPELISLLDRDLAYVFPISGSVENITVSVLQAIFYLSHYTEVLGVLVHPNAVQIVNFKKTLSETKEVVDLLDVNLIPGLEVATGTPLEEQTAYSPFARSIVVEAEPLSDNALATPELLNNGDHEVGVANISKTKKSAQVQYVYDRLKYIEDTVAIKGKQINVLFN